MEIKTDLRNGKSLQILFEDLGYQTWWDGNGILNILEENDKKRDKLAEAMCKEYRNTGWVPYHYVLSPSKKGKVHSGEKVEFVGQATEIVTLRNMLGMFNMVLFESEDGNNYVWKSYTTNLPPPERRKITGRPVCKLTKGTHVLNLMNYVRTYEIK